MKTPTVLLAVTAIAASALTGLAQDSVKDDLKDAWNATKRGVKKAGDAIEQKVDELTTEAKDEVDPREVQVKLTEYEIVMPESIRPGKTKFVVTNMGKKKHNFEITGKGLDNELKKNLEPGETANLTATLAKGTYEVVCPVGDHEKEGMKRKLIVE